MMAKPVGFRADAAPTFAYAEHDKGARTSVRVEWAENVNCIQATPEGTERMWARLVADAPELKRQAGGSSRGRKLEKPYGHYVLSWHPEDDPSRDHIRAAVKDAMDRIGYGECQYRIIVHHDTEYIHAHVVVCRVHPEDGRAMGRKNDGDQLRRWSLDYEKAQGQIRIKGRLADLTDRARHSRRKRAGQGPTPPTPPAAPAAARPARESKRRGSRPRIRAKTGANIELSEHETALWHDLRLDQSARGVTEYAAALERRALGRIGDLEGDEKGWSRTAPRELSKLIGAPPESLPKTVGMREPERLKPPSINIELIIAKAVAAVARARAIPQQVIVDLPIRPPEITFADLEQYRLYGGAIEDLLTPSGSGAAPERPDDDILQPEAGLGAGERDGRARWTIAPESADARPPSSAQAAPAKRVPSTPSPTPAAASPASRAPAEPGTQAARSAGRQPTPATRARTPEEESGDERREEKPRVAAQDDGTRSTAPKPLLPVQVDPLEMMKRAAPATTPRRAADSVGEDKKPLFRPDRDPFRAAKPTTPKVPTAPMLTVTRSQGDAPSASRGGSVAGSAGLERSRRRRGQRGPGGT